MNVLFEYDGTVSEWFSAAPVTTDCSSPLYVYVRFTPLVSMTVAFLSTVTVCAGIAAST